jgi:hypothetical protein
MKQVNEDILRAFVSLRNSESFLVFCGWLTDTLLEIDKETRWEASATLLHQKQGQGQVLEQILEKVNTADVELAALYKRANQRTLR